MFLQQKQMSRQYTDIVQVVPINVFHQND